MISMSIGSVCHGACQVVFFDRDMHLEKVENRVLDFERSDGDEQDEEDEETD